ncbi:MAG: hypothetical protein QXL16_02815 [Candidatus Micrarchaeaceae archaeon]
MARKKSRYYKVRGRLYELAVEELVKKAGFETDRDKLKDIGIRQISKNGRSVHGRGGTYRADVIGLYSLPIPFTYPMLLIGEAKYQKEKVSIAEAREFLGIHTDISQYPRINTKSKLWKYSEMFKETRYNYAPVMFSANGFRRNPQALLYAHGIYFISYENSPIFGTIKKALERLLKQIKTAKMLDDDMALLNRAKSLSEIKNIRADAKKKKFNYALGKLLAITQATNSYIGMLDNTLMLHILSNTQLRRPTYEVMEAYPQLMEGNFILLKSSNKERARKIGGFSLPSQFLERYVKNATENGKPCFNELVIYKNYEGKLFPIYVKLAEQGRKEIIDMALAADTMKNKKGRLRGRRT